MPEPVTPAEAVKIHKTTIIRVGGNAFVEKTDAGVTDDLFQELRDIADSKPSA